MKLTTALLSATLLLSACSPDAGKAQQPSGSLKPSLGGTLPATDPAKLVPGSVTAMKSSFSPVVKAAAPAVVNVYARRVVRQRVDPFWELFNGSAPRQRVEQSLGSGVIVRGDGVIVTNAHVVEGGQEFMVVLADRREFPAKLLLADQRTDLAVLKIDTGKETLPTLNLQDRKEPDVGDLVLAIGNPFGVGQTVTNGIVSAINRTDVGNTDDLAYIQTDASINPGNSGGALVDMDANLIGINSFILSKSGSSAGVGFAVPARVVRRVVETAVGGGQRLVRPWLGAAVDGVNSEIAKSLGLDRPGGVLINQLYPGAAAAKAGLLEGDVVVKADAAEITDPTSLNYRISTRRPGDVIPLEVIRRGKRVTISLVAEVAPNSPAKDERTLKGEHPLSGATVVNLSPALAEELGADPMLGKGVLILKLSGRGYAAGAGFEPGDLVTRINGKAVGSTKDLEQMLSGSEKRWAVTVSRRGQELTGDFRR